MEENNNTTLSPHDIASKLNEISQKIGALAGLLGSSETTDRDLILESSDRKGLAMFLSQLSDEVCAVGNEIYETAGGKL